MMHWLGPVMKSLLLMSAYAGHSQGSYLVRVLRKIVLQSRQYDHAMFIGLQYCDVGLCLMYSSPYKSHSHADTTLTAFPEYLSP